MLEDKRMMDHEPMLTWRSGLNILAVVMAFLAALLLYGTHPRRKDVEVVHPSEEPEPLNWDDRVLHDSDGPVNHIDWGKLTNDVYADNFDIVPGIDLDEVLEHLIRVENPGRDVNAVGDKHLTHKAYGILQIRQPYLDDVNKIAGTSYTIEDMKDPAKARWAAKVYLNHYGERYQRKTGNEPTLQVYARIHNGGPNGWRKASTNNYVRKINGGLK
jgi:hypothetical protein